MESGFVPASYQVDDVTRSKINQLRVAELVTLARQLGCSRTGAKQQLISNILEKLYILSSKFARREIAEVDIRRAFEAVDQQYQERMHGSVAARRNPGSAPVSPGAAPAYTAVPTPTIPQQQLASHHLAQPGAPLPGYAAVPPTHSGYASQPAVPPHPSSSALNSFFPASSKAASYSGSSSSSGSGSSSYGQNQGHNYPVPQRCYEAFNENPFHRWLRVLRSARLVSLRDNHNKPFAVTFDLDKNFERGHSVWFYSFQLSSASENVHAWPTSLDLRINGRPLPPNALKRASKKSKDEPFEMTGYLRGGSNTVELTSSVYTPFLMVINLHQRLTLGQLEAAVLSRPQVDYEHALYSVRRIMGYGDEDVQALSSKVSLIDPLMLVPVVQPCKSLNCNHIQCFDLRTFLGMNERVSRWKCPVCDKAALFRDLYIDPFMKRVLQEVPAGVTEVAVEPDGSWSVPSGAQPATVIKNEEPSRPAASATMGNVFDLNDSDGDAGSDYDADRDRPNGTPNGHSAAAGPEPAYTVCPRCADRMPVGGSCATCAATQASAAVLAPKACYVCKKTGKSMRCSQCKSIDYCGRDCQAADWPRHKTECYARPSPPVAALPPMPRPAASELANPKLKQPRLTGSFGAVSASLPAPANGSAWGAANGGEYAPAQPPRPPAAAGPPAAPGPGRTVAAPIVIIDDDD